MCTRALDFTLLGSASKVKAKAGIGSGTTRPSTRRRRQRQRCLLSFSYARVCMFALTCGSSGGASHRQGDGSGLSCTGKACVHSGGSHDVGVHYVPISTVVGGVS